MPFLTLARYTLNLDSSQLLTFDQDGDFLTDIPTNFLTMSSLVDVHYQIRFAYLCEQILHFREIKWLDCFN